MNSANEQQSFDLMKMDHQITRRAKREQWLHALAWGGLVAIGVRRRGLIGFAIATFGLERLARTLGVQTFWQKYNTSGRAKSPVEMAPVDHSSWESFPASDPPAHGPS
jgi:hypothetical protein